MQLPIRAQQLLDISSILHCEHISTALIEQIVLAGRAIHHILIQKGIIPDLKAGVPVFHFG